MGKLKDEVKAGLPDLSETPSESHDLKSSSPGVVGDANSHLAVHTNVEVNTSSIAAPHAKKAKLQQQLHNVERQVTVLHARRTAVVWAKSKVANPNAGLRLGDQLDQQLRR